MKKDLLNEAKRLYDMGLAVHWLRPQSKIPVFSKWTSGERIGWDELKRTYHKGYNIGCRLGDASKVTEGYLAVLDVDIKSDNPIHKDQAYKWIEKHFPGLLDSTTITLSGRGLGSCHAWVKTKTPIDSRRLYSSPETCSVRMPSVKATPEQIKILGQKKIDEGYRIRPAFEVDIMSIGKQVVLPPSIHPDTGDKYKWKNKLESISTIKLVEFNLPAIKENTSTKEPVGDWRPIEKLNLETRLDNKTLSMIIDGEDVEDRSAACFTVCMKLIRAGFNDDEILTILTDPNTFLGRTSYDHTKSKSRKRAAQWIKNYTLKNAKENLESGREFNDVTVDDNKEPWKEKLEKTQHGKARPSLTNIILIIKSVVGINTFKRNDFSHIDIYGERPPWNDKKVGDQIQDVDITNIISWFAHKWEFEPSELKINQAVTQIANENKFHPVKTYLDGLVWDKKPRVNLLLKKYFNAQGPKHYLQAISKKFLCAMVARIYSPGVKFDTVLILEGKQGIGKSTAAQILGGEWFTDTGIQNIGDKDSYMALQGKWLIELGELSSIRKADLEKIKAYVAAQNDDLRPPYGRRSERFPRQSIFIGTTNADNYLNDPSGNRRFWPVKVTKCEIELLKKDRDQLFAEAIHLFRTGEKLYLNEDENALAQNEQKKRMYYDPWEEELRTFIKMKINDDDFSFNPDKFSLRELSDHTPFMNVVNDPRDTKRISLVLKTLGYKSRSSNGKNFWEPIDTNEF